MSVNFNAKSITPLNVPMADASGADGVSGDAPLFEPAGVNVVAVVGTTGGASASGSVSDPDLSSPSVFKDWAEIMALVAELRSKIGGLKEKMTLVFGGGMHDTVKFTVEGLLKKLNSELNRAETAGYVAEAKYYNKIGANAANNAINQLKMIVTTNEHMIAGFKASLSELNDENDPDGSVRALLTEQISRLESINDAANEQITLISDAAKELAEYAALAAGGGLTPEQAKEYAGLAKQALETLYSAAGLSPTAPELTRSGIGNDDPAVLASMQDVGATLAAFSRTDLSELRDSIRSQVMKLGLRMSEEVEQLVEMLAEVIMLLDEVGEMLSGSDSDDDNPMTRTPM